MVNGVEIMNEKTLRMMVERILLSEMAKSGELYVPVSSSNRHIHLSQKDLEQLFGSGYQLTKVRDLVQPGQFACEESVMLETPKGKMMLRVVGPARKETQIELTYTDAIRLGLQPMIRLSGDISGTPGGIIKNGNARVVLTQGIIVAARHLHLSSDQAECYGLRDGDVVSLYVEGERAMAFHNMVVRAGDGHTLEAHIDREEAISAMLKDGTICRIERQSLQKPTEKPSVLHPILQDVPGVHIQSKKERRLITEADVKNAYAMGQKAILLEQGDIITPLARDVVWEYRMKINYAEIKESI